MSNENPAEAVFEPLNFMGLKLRNHFIRSATVENMASGDGAPTKELRKLYNNLSSGGVGLISTSACWPDPSWKIVPEGWLVLSDRSDLAIWEEMIHEVHDRGAKVSMQMAPFVVLKGRPVGPSEHQSGVHALTADEIHQIVLAYAGTAALARKIGFDAVQVHAGHGYGVSQFLSPHFNRRHDDYGGSAENRIRILVEIRKAIAEAAGEGFPVWIKMNAFEGIRGGLTPKEAATHAPLLAKGGYRAIEVTGGSIGESTHNSRGPIEEEKWFEGYYLEATGQVKCACDVPIIAVGGIRRLDMIAQILLDGIADLISLSRPFIREPGLIKRWAEGDTTPAACISCNGCFKMIEKGKHLSCVQSAKDNLR